MNPHTNASVDPMWESLSRQWPNLTREEFNAAGQEGVRRVSEEGWKSSVNMLEMLGLVTTILRERGELR